MEREAFLERVRTALGEGRRTELPRASPTYSPPTHKGRPRATRLARELEAVGGVVHRVESPAAARTRILELLRGLGARRLIRGNAPKLVELALDADFGQEGIELTIADLRNGTPAESLREAAFAADVGLSSAEYGVAETGTLALACGPGQGRAVSLLPPVHIAVLDAGDIVDELAALFEKFDSGLPSALTLVTGPSRTGDIELVLTVGVHGPGELHLVLIG